MEPRRLNDQVIAEHLDQKLIEVLTKALSWGAVIMGGAARFLQQSTLHVTDYPEDTDIYCLGDKDLEHKVVRLLRESYHPPAYCGNREYGGHRISSHTVDAGRQYPRRAPSFSSHSLQVIHLHAFEGPYTITDVWDTFDMTICQAAIVYGQDRAVMDKHDIWLDDYLEIPNERIKTIRPPLYVQRPDYSINPRDRSRLSVPWVGVVSDAFIEADKCNITRYKIHPCADWLHAQRRISKYYGKGFAFYWDDLAFMLEDTTYHSFIRGMKRSLVGGDEKREMFEFLMDAAKADYLKDIL